MPKTPFFKTPAASMDLSSIVLLATCFAAACFSAGCRTPWQGNPLVKSESASLAWLDSSSENVEATDSRPQPPRAKRRPGSPEMTALRGEGKLPRSQLRPSEAEIAPAALATTPLQRKVGDLEQSVAANASADQADDAKLDRDKRPSSAATATAREQDQIALASHAAAELDAASRVRAATEKMKKADLANDKSSAPSHEGEAITIRITDLDDADSSEPIPGSQDTAIARAAQDAGASPQTKLEPNSQPRIVEAANPVEQDLELPAEEKPTQSMKSQTEVQPASAEQETTATVGIAVSPAAAPITAALMTIDSTGNQPPSVNIAELGLSELASAIVDKIEDKLDQTNNVDLRRELSVRKQLVTLMLEDLSAGDDVRKRINPDSERSIRSTLLAIYEAANVQDDPSNRVTETLKHHRIAIRDLANLAELKVLSLAFCTAVDGFGMIDKFPDYAFRADQKVLLYCELENFVSVQVDRGYETKLSGHYEIVDADGKRLEYYPLPPDKDICSNRRSDFYIAYLMQMPQKIPPGDYQLRLLIEDVHGEKTGKSEIDFRIKS